MFPFSFSASVCLRAAHLHSDKEEETERLGQKRTGESERQNEQEGERREREREGHIHRRHRCMWECQNSQHGSHILGAFFAGNPPRNPIKPGFKPSLDLNLGALPLPPGPNSGPRSQDSSEARPPTPGLWQRRFFLDLEIWVALLIKVFHDCTGSMRFLEMRETSFQWSFSWCSFWFRHLFGAWVLWPRPRVLGS